ncbi:hypothetical protein O9X98_06110 [Agrobacterium salinitolerans]|nr:hypothetical protein [Agrobacterium salinitolerans]
MQINLPDESRLKRIADKLQGALKGKLGIDVNTTKSRDIAARMIGFEGFQNFRQRNIPTPPSFWDEDQPEGIGELRHRQYVSSLVAEKIKGLDLETAEEVVTAIGPTTKPKSGKAGEVYIASAFSERWQLFTGEEIDRLGGGLTQHEAKQYAVAMRRIGNPADFDDPAYAGYVEINSARGSEVSVILVATNGGEEPIVLGHVCYRTWINADAREHKVEIVSIFVDTERINRYDQAARIRSVIEASLRAVIVEDVRKRHEQFWKELASDHGKLAVIIAPELSEWEDISVPMQIVERIGRELGAFSDPFREEKAVFANYAISIENDTMVCLPRIGRLVASPSDHPRGAKFISLLEYKGSWVGRSRVVLRLDPVKGTQDLFSWSEDGIFPYDPEDQYDGRDELRDVMLQTPRALSAAVANGDATDLLTLCRGKVKILIASRGYACLIDEDTVIRSIWDPTGRNADWVVDDETTRNPGLQAYYDLMLGLLRKQLGSYRP